MNNNDILRRIRYVFDFRDAQMQEIFQLVNTQKEKKQIVSWLSKSGDIGYEELKDEDLASFLNGLIILKRGKREGPLPVAEKELNNNLILKKLKIALNLKTGDIVAIFKLAERHISPHELTAFLRNPKQSQYRECNDQYLRNFLAGLQVMHR